MPSPVTNRTATETGQAPGNLAGGHIIAFCKGTDRFGKDLAEHLFRQARGPEDWTIADREIPLPPPEARAPGALSIVDFVGLNLTDGMRSRLRTAIARLQRRIAQADAAGDVAVLWLLTRGGGADAPGAPASPAAGLWDFARAAAREHPGLDIKRIDLDPDLSPDEAAGRLLQALHRPGDADEIMLRRESPSLPAGGSAGRTSPQ